jgi:hypothetical protein
MTDSLFTVPAAVARPLREGLHTEFGIAAEQIAGLAENIGERPFEVYREPLTRQDEARTLLEQIGGATPNPPAAVPVDLDMHRPMLLRALEEQQRSYRERLSDMNDTEQQAATERIQSLHAVIWAIQHRR